MAGIDVNFVSENELKIFINHANSYHGKHILRALKNKENGREAVDQTTMTEELLGDGTSKTFIDFYSNKNHVEKMFEEKETATELRVKMPKQIKKCVVTATIDPSLENASEWENYLDWCIQSDSKEFESTILNQDFIVYDVNFHLNQVDEAFKVLKMLEEWSDRIDATGLKDDVKKHFILISNLMTWADTDTSQLAISEKNYRKRRPHPCYRRYLRLEQEVTNAQVKHKNRLRTLIINPGVTCGYEEDILHYVFKMALYNKDDIEVFAPGTNNIPLIEVGDLAEMVGNMIQNYPVEEKYLLAFNPKIKYLELIRNVCQLITGSNAIRVKIFPKEHMISIDRDLMTQRIYDKLNLDLKWRLSYFKNFKFRTSFEQLPQKLVEQFYACRNIQPKKILIHGPPNCGKTTLAKALACHYGLMYIDPENILEDELNRLERKIKLGIEYLENQSKHDVTKKQDFYQAMIDTTGKCIEDWKNKTEEIKNAMKEKNKKMIEKLKERCLQEKLNLNACTKNQGYVIDTLFYDIEAVKRIFLQLDTEEMESGEEKIERHDEKHELMTHKLEKEIIESSNTSLEELNLVESIQELTANGSQVIMKSQLKPDLFIYFKFDEELLQKEEACTCQKYEKLMMNSSKANQRSSITSFNLFSTVSDTSLSLFTANNNGAPFSIANVEKLILKDTINKAVAHHEWKRIADYMTTEFEDQSLYTFMLDCGLQPFEIVFDSNSNPTSIYRKVTLKLGPRNEYVISDEKQKEEEKRLKEMAREEQEAEEKKALQDTMKKRKAREAELEQEFNKTVHFKRKEIKRLEYCSIQLRNYLLNRIIPKLKCELVEISAKYSEDPIDVLAECLVKNQSKGFALDPSLVDCIAEEIVGARANEMEGICKCISEEKLPSSSRKSYP